MVEEFEVTLSTDEVAPELVLIEPAISQLADAANAFVAATEALIKAAREAARQPAADRLLTVQEVADRLGLKTQQTYALIWDNVLPSVRIGDRQRVVESVLNDYIMSRRTDAHPELQYHREPRPRKSQSDPTTPRKRGRPKKALEVSE